MNHLSYSYETGRQALDDVSLTIKRGERIALVGPSGSGKTTLTHLILGFIQADDDAIKLDDLSFNHLNIEDWRQQLAWMPQTPHLFHGTIRDNISLGNNNTSDQDIQKAASLASADVFISALANGYETQIGDKGQGLSGGQIQRLALARAFLKDAPLVILDEATANLDSESEALIQQSINTLAKDRTLLIVAHRLNTVINANRILVFDKGRIVEQGKHAELIAQKGLYSELVKAFEGVQ